MPNIYSFRAEEPEEKLFGGVTITHRRAVYG